MIISEEELDEQLEIEESLEEEKPSRLHGAVIKSDRWEVEEVNNRGYSTYILKDKEDCYSYTFNQIIGFEQVADNEFLVYERTGWDDFAIFRYRLTKNKKQVLFEQKVYHFFELSEDHMLFTYCTNSAAECVRGVYSISKNDYVPEAEWLSRSSLMEFKVNDQYITILSKDVYPDNKVLFDFDEETFKPKEICYSTSQKIFINVKTGEDVERVVREDEAYLWNKKEQELKLKRKEAEDAAIKIIKKELSK